MTWSRNERKKSDEVSLSNLRKKLLQRFGKYKLGQFFFFRF